MSVFASTRRGYRVITTMRARRFGHGLAYLSSIGRPS